MKYSINFGVKDLANMMGIEIHQFVVKEDGHTEDIPNDGKVNITIKEEE